jgi:hypothetical protein
MDKLPVNIAKEEAIKAIKDYRVVAEIWGGENTKNRKLCISFAYPRIEGKINESAKK